jgi:hypothetical protein
MHGILAVLVSEMEVTRRASTLISETALRYRSVGQIDRVTSMSAKVELNLALSVMDLSTRVSLE